MTINIQSFVKKFPLLAAFLYFISGVPATGQLKILENGEPTLVGQDASLDIDTQSRRKIDLAGTWTYSADNESWKEVRIPSSFDYQGRIVFVRKFNLDKIALTNSAFHLVAMGINHDAEIYVNDVFVGKHLGGYTTIDIDIPENVLQLGSENAVKIIVNNALTARSTLPLRKQIWGWRNYGGILRDIYLLVTPRLWVDRLGLHSELAEDLAQGSVAVTAVLNSKLSESTDDTLASLLRGGQPSFVFEVVDKSSGAVVGQSAPQPVSVQPNRDYEVKANVAVKAPRAWSPENPELYLVRGKIVLQQGKQSRLIDEIDRVIGFRRIVLDKDVFVLNGKPITLRGVVWHEDAPQYGASLTYEQMSKDIALVKELGANAIRFAFHTPHPYVLNLCDKFGLLALVEIPAWSVPGEILDQDHFETLAEDMLTEVVELNLHHPSIIAWGVGDNLDAADPRTCKFVEKVAGAAKKLDGRPVYFGSSVYSADACTGKTDIAALEVSVDHGGSLKTMLASWKSLHADQPVIVLAYGKDVEPENRNGWSDPMSQEAQAEFFKKSFAIIKGADVAGSFIDAFADWRGDRPLMAVSAGDRYEYPVGLMSYARERRRAYEMVTLLYNGEKTTALPIGKYRATFPVAHIAWGFVVIFVLAYLYHYNRRFNETFKRALVRSYNFYADLRDVRSVSIPQTFILAAAASLTLGVIFSGVLYRFRSDMIADDIVSLIIPWDVLKEPLISATWHPIQGIILFSAVFMAWYPLVATSIKIFSLLVKRRVYWYHAFAVAVWGSLPVVLLSPLGMALFKLLQTDIYVVPSFVVIVLFLGWAFLRTLKGVSVIYDVSRFKAYAGGLFVLLVLVGGLFIYYEYTFGLTAYTEFFCHLGRSIG